MENTYVTKHNWGSFESNATINKLRLRNEQDLKEYLNVVLPIIFETKNVGKDIVQINNSNKFEISIALENVQEK